MWAAAPTLAALHRRGRCRHVALTCRACGHGRSSLAWIGDHVVEVDGLDCSTRSAAVVHSLLAQNRWVRPSVCGCARPHPSSRLSCAAVQSGGGAASAQSTSWPPIRGTSWSVVRCCRCRCCCCFCCCHRPHSCSASQIRAGGEPGCGGHPVRVRSALWLLPVASAVRARGCVCVSVSARVCPCVSPHTLSRCATPCTCR